MPFRSAGRGSYIDFGGNQVASHQMLPRGSFSDQLFGQQPPPTDSLLNNSNNISRGTGGVTASMVQGGPCISDLLQNQMPGHKMSIDFTNRNPDPK